MNALKLVRGLLGKPTPEEVARLAEELDGNARNLSAKLDALDSTPVTVAQFLCGGVRHGIDFAFYDELAKKADEVLADNPDASFTTHGVREALRVPVDHFLGTLQRAAPYRRLPK